MSDLISRQAAIDAIHNKMILVGSYLTDSSVGFEFAEDEINNLPPADVAQIRHSRWIKTKDGAECEKCGREAVYQIVDDHWEYEPWCPHCGSKMDKAEEDNE